MVSNLVSIIMPAYNGEVFIRQAIESVVAQTHTTWELIVIDDGSTDCTAEIVATFKDPRIRYTYQENRGQAAALNRGLDLARGEYITTLDVDDWLTSNSLFDRVHFLDQHSEYGAVYGDGYYCDVTGKLLLRFSEHRINNVYGDVYDILITTPFFGTGANVMVRREILEKYQIRYDESIIWCQDYDFYIRIAEKVAFGLVETFTVWYRLHEGNMTMSIPRGRRLESYIRTKNKVLASPRFITVTTPLKIKFFWDLLTQVLRNRPENLTTVIESPQFQSLPRQHQARLIRLTANNHLLNGNNTEFARDWLRKALLLAPFDPKTISVAILTHLNPKLVKVLIKWWQKKAVSKDANISPFEMIKGA